MLRRTKIEYPDKFKRGGVGLRLALIGRLIEKGDPVSLAIADRLSDEVIAAMTPP